MIVGIITLLIALANGRATKREEQKEGPAVDEPIDTGLFYDEYLQKVIKVLEEDPEFREKMANVNFEEIKVATFSKELNNVAKHVRDKLDDIKRKEIDRIRKLLKAKSQMAEGKKINHKQLINEMAGHLDHFNADTFQAKDLEKLIDQATNDLKEYDVERHEKFKEYEMQKALEEELKMSKMNELEKKQYEENLIKKKKAHKKQAQNLPHPFSRKFLLDIWNTYDHLKGEDFQPKTFFMLHDVNGDKYLDAYELEAIFQYELDKIYDPENDDLREMEEERANMREHVMKEVDTDKDGAVSLDEFIKYTKTKEFERPSNEYQWIDEMIEDGDIFSEDDLRKYRLQVQEHEETLKTKLAHLKTEAMELAKHKQQFQVAKVQAEQMDDPKVKQAIAETEKELNKREMGLMERHKDVLEHGKATLEMKQDLAKQQVKAHLQSADLEDFKKQYEEAKDNAAKLLAEKEAEYKQQMEEAQAKIKAAQEKVQADIAAKQAELLAGIEQLQAQKVAEEKQQL